MTLSSSRGSRARRRRAAAAAAAIVAVLVLSAVALSRPSRSSRPPTPIAVFVRAVLAPYDALIRHDARALCGDFTVRAITHTKLVKVKMGCRASLEAALATRPRLLELPALDHGERFTVGRIIGTGTEREVETVYHGSKVAQLWLRLANISGRWRIATPPLFGITTTPRGHTLVFAVGFPGTVTVGPPLPPPRS